MDRLDAGEERAHDRPLERREEIDEIGRESLRVERSPVDAALLELAEHRRLQAGKGEVVGAVARASDREGKARAVSARRDAVDDRAARVSESGPPSHLVERLAGGVVAGPRQGHDAVRLDADELRVAAGDDEAVKGIFDGKGGLARGAEPRRVEMPLQVVDRDEREAARVGERAGGREPDEEGADQAGTGRRGY